MSEICQQKAGVEGWVGVGNNRDGFVERGRRLKLMAESGGGEIWVFPPRPRFVGNETLPKSCALSVRWASPFFASSSQGSDSIQWSRHDVGANLVPKLPLELRNNGDDRHRFFESFVSLRPG